MKPHRTCQLCKGPTTYSSKYDSFGCKKCLIWREGMCGCEPSECEFKKARLTHSRPVMEDFDPDEP